MTATRSEWAMAVRVRKVTGVSAAKFAAIRHLPVDRRRASPRDAGQPQRPLSCKKRGAAERRRETGDLHVVRWARRLETTAPAVSTAGYLTESGRAAYTQTDERSPDRAVPPRWRALSHSVVAGRRGGAGAALLPLGVQA